MLFSIKSFVSKISPLDPKEGFLYYKTSKYTLHYFETPSGLKFILNTDNASQNARELLQQLYREVRFYTCSSVLELWIYTNFYNYLFFILGIPGICSKESTLPIKCTYTKWIVQNKSGWTI